MNSVVYFPVKRIKKDMQEFLGNKISINHESFSWFLFKVLFYNNNKVVKHILLGNLLYIYLLILAVYQRFGSSEKERKIDWNCANYTEEIGIYRLGVIPWLSPQGASTKKNKNKSNGKYTTKMYQWTETRTRWGNEKWGKEE